MNVLITQSFAIIRKSINFRLFSIIFILSLAWPCLALEISKPQTDTGAMLFEDYCVGCHANGKNIIRRSKTLFKDALSKQGLFNLKAITTITKAGIGQMSGYDDQITSQEAEVISNWIYLEAMNNWSHS